MKIAPSVVRRWSVSRSGSVSDSEQAGGSHGAGGAWRGHARRTFALTPLVALVVLGGACDDSDLVPADGGVDARGDTGSGDGGDGAATPAAVCAWDRNAPELLLPRSEVKGVLRGQSRNASTTCTRQKGSGGPEAIYLLRVAERTVVELETVSALDTVIAIRRTCDDPLSELACNDLGIQVDTAPAGGAVDAAFGSSPGGGAMVPGAAPFSPDAGAPVPTQTRDGHVRTVVDPGAYFVIIDEAEPFGVGGEFTLKATSSAPPAQSSCQGALPLIDGTSLAAEQLDLSSQKDPGCSGAAPLPALFYSALIPSGQRLTARVHATRGDRAWTPTMQLFTACDDGICLGTDRASPDGDRILRFVNNGSAAQLVYLSVGATAPVSGAVFRLDVNIGEPIVNATCQSARPISDGQLLRNQDLAEGQVSNDSSCKPFGGQSLFYSAKLLPRQSMNITVAAHETSFGRSPLFLVVREGCGQNAQCQQNPEPSIGYFNSTGLSKTVIVEVTSFQGGIPPVFDLMVSLPLPAGGVSVSPTQGLVTSEAGAQATFDVVLTAPPLQPTTIALASSDPKEGTVQPAGLTFDQTNWDKPQKATITGANDDNKDGDKAYTILVQPSVSLDPRYAGLDGSDVQVVNLDDDPGLRIVTPTFLVTSESGAPASFKAVLNRAPTATVHVPLASSDEGEGKVSPPELVFEPANWNVPQTVTLTGVDDSDRDGSQAYRVVIGVLTSADPGYAGTDPADLDARNSDNDYEAITAQAISGDLGCGFGGSGQRIAADDVGTIYTLMVCDGSIIVPRFDGGAGGSSGGIGGSAGGEFDAGFPVPPPAFDAAPIPSDAALGPQIFAAVSLDGGHTFGPPRPLGIAAFDAQVVGGAAGWAAMTANVQGLGFALVRTEDGGATWKPPQLLALQGNNTRLAASGQHLAITAETENGAVIWTSDNGGRTLKRSQLTNGFGIMALAVDPDATVHVALFDGTLRLQRSTNGGVSFDVGVLVPIDNQPDSIALGPSRLFATAFGSSEVLVAPLPDGAMPIHIPGSQPGMVGRSFIPNATGGAALVDGTANGMQLRWLGPAATTLGMGRSLGVVDGAIAGVALSDTAVVLTFQRNGRQWASVEIAP
jgi:hypothetical protein